MNKRLSATLEFRAGSICCRRCQHAVTNANVAWKPHASLREMPLDPGSNPGAAVAVVLREFSCPKCGTLLDVETAMKGDPLLEDRVAF